MAPLFVILAVSVPESVKLMPPCEVTRPEAVTSARVLAPCRQGRVHRTGWVAPGRQPELADGDGGRVAPSFVHPSTAQLHCTRLTPTVRVLELKVAPAVSSGAPHVWWRAVSAHVSKEVSQVAVQQHGPRVQCPPDNLTRLPCPVRATCHRCRLHRSSLPPGCSARS